MNEKNKMSKDRIDPRRNKDNVWDRKKPSKYSNQYLLKHERILHPKMPVKQEWAAMKRKNQ